MDHVTTQEEAFAETIRSYSSGEETKDELRELCIEHGLFGGEESARILRSYQDRVIRKLARKRIETDDGGVIELVNIVRHDIESGAKVHKYIQLPLLSLEDQVQLVNDRLDKKAYFHAEAKRYYDDGVIKFGRKFQKRFDCF